MLVERSVHTSECDGLGWVATGGFVNGRLKRERVQAKSGSFFGEEYVVEILEQQPKPAIGALAGFRRSHVRPPVALLGSLLRLGHPHPLSASLVADLDLGEAASQLAPEAVGAQTLGALSDLE